MLSYLYQIARHFEQQHGYPPNILYLSSSHLFRLQNDLADIPQLSDLTLFLGMELVLSDDYTHPKVAWTTAEWRHTIAV